MRSDCLEQAGTGILAALIFVKHVIIDGDALSTCDGVYVEMESFGLLKKISVIFVVN